MPAPEPPCSHSYAGYASRGLGKTMMFSAFIVVLLLGAAFRGDPSADGPATELNHLPMEVPAGSELQLALVCHPGLRSGGLCCYGHGHVPVF